MPCPRLNLEVKEDPQRVITVLSDVGARTWAQRLLMFFGGVMNLYWVAGLVLFERTVPVGHWLGYATGVALLVWGAGMLALAF